MKGEVRQDMFKRFLAAALSALLFLQALPLEALADGERFLISEAELEAAVALSGLDEDAAGWHDGMTPSENMNAAQIAGYLERLIEHDLKGLMDTAQDVEKALADLLLSDPQRYAELTSGNGSLAQLDSLTANLRAMMDDLSYDHDELVAQSDYIYTNRNAPFNAEYCEKERIQYGRSIREASETIRAIIPAVVQHYPAWEQSLAEWRALLGAGTTDLRASASDLSQLTTQLLQPSPVQERTLSRDALGIPVPASTRMQRLSAGTAEPDMKITVLNDNSFGICVSLPDHTAPRESRSQWPIWMRVAQQKPAYRYQRPCHFCRQGLFTRQRWLHECEHPRGKGGVPRRLRGQNLREKGRRIQRPHPDC